MISFLFWIGKYDLKIESYCKSPPHTKRTLSSRIISIFLLPILPSICLNNHHLFHDQKAEKPRISYSKRGFSTPYINPELNSFLSHVVLKIHHEGPRKRSWSPASILETNSRRKATTPLQGYSDHKAPKSPFAKEKRDSLS